MQHKNYKNFLIIAYGNTNSFYNTVKNKKASQLRGFLKTQSTQLISLILQSFQHYGNHRFSSR